MKTLIKNSYILLTAGLLITSCKKFDDLNNDPLAASEEQVQIEYFINNSIIGTQMDPGVAERSFILYWKTAAHQHSVSGFATGGYDDGWTTEYYNQISGWLNSINSAIEIAPKKVEAGVSKPYDNNLVQVARIWRAYLMSEMSDNFGPIAVNAFQGVNPGFDSEKTVYYYIMDELKDAVSKIDISVVNPSGLDKLDAAYGYNYQKWKKYGNSLRMRLAMRLSEVDAVKAKSEFEAAAASENDLIITMDDAFQVQERDGWDPLAGVMSRTWNTQLISASLNNIYLGLGGVKTENQVADSLHSYIRPANWMGLKFANHFTTLTNDPSAGYWFDGLPYSIDPRAYKTFIIPGNFSDPNFTDNGTDSKTTKRNLMSANGETVVKEIEAKHTWNARVAGNWGTKGVMNQVVTFEGTMPRLSRKFRNHSMKRIFFAPWETYFLLAEANVRGWTTPVGGREAYEKGISLNFSYWGVSDFVADYLQSANYNRVGTSVRWDHTTEPPASYTMNFKDGYTGTDGVATVMYPKNDLYQNGNIKNDHLTKIITQKYLAHMPYLPLEAWNDKRRLGLPFFENPAVETQLVNMPALTQANYMTSRVQFFPQRVKYPSGLPNTNPAGYKQAVDYLGGSDAVLTPLWWAKKQ
ncbi:SusD-like starch-binding protein associating with outer membrane [Arcticibacter tournemirensis]|uniref:SusD/RagB family nutrient-binding outer membrane lipoprotein n=1 Tax=Arcticibacter tournemirensis TaxID=699437 RepID=A0A5M9HA81_9SPHI|nr:SusD/RagB family nutrient-binding outer membrane lipoprotein [Arcticibacter tournemirensis]KAA8483853.1 SusD/RagB family nutrient-binding outer membrane lipoprotein [Arcticibacter tournemirensis]TQM49929.1 SusD-like starch-binding protein associating with outer membrane [Arcticibacter tournemirensis]